MFDWLELPGDPRISRPLEACLLVCGEIGVYVFLMLWLKHYLGGRSSGTRLLGICVGATVGLFASRIYVATIAHILCLSQGTVSLLLLLGFIFNLHLTARFVYPPISQTGDTS
jgi:hypothetical protein